MIESTEAPGLNVLNAAGTGAAWAPTCDLSVIMPALDEGPNLRRLLPAVRQVLESLDLRFEVLVVTERADRATREAADAAGTAVLEQRQPGYGGALVTGFAAARGAWWLTMDADLSHSPEFIRELWAHRDAAEVVIASRYVAGGTARMPWVRLALSRILNGVFHWALDVPVHDLSSGFRLYAAAVLREQEYPARDFDVLQQILVRAYAEGWRVREVPFAYEPRRHGSSHARIVRFGMAYLRTFWSMWKLRNSILAADYDDRAHDSRIWLQRYWQRSRHRHVTDLIAGEGPVLDVGCGSSRIIGALPPGSVGLDVLRRKLRHARRFGRPLVHASGFSLPFADRSFPCVLCSQVIEHVPRDSPILAELERVLAPGGRLVLGTPDYDQWQWVWIEKAYALVAPGGYADEHMTRYTRRELEARFIGRGYTLEATRYILRGELILAFRKGDPAS